MGWRGEEEDGFRTEEALVDKRLSFSFRLDRAVSQYPGLSGQCWCAFPVTRAGLPVPSSSSLLSCPLPFLQSGESTTAPAVTMTLTWMSRVCGDGGAGSPAQPTLYLWRWRTRLRASV